MITNQLISVVKIWNFWRKLFEIMPRSLWLTSWSWFLILGWSLISANSRQKMPFKSLYLVPECRKMHLNSQIFWGSMLDPPSILPRFPQSNPRFAWSLWATKDDFGPLKKIYTITILPLLSHFSPICIHVIFSWTQIGRFWFSDREIGVSNREIFSRQKIRGPCPNWQIRERNGWSPSCQC